MWVYLAGESVRCTWQAGKCDTGQKRSALASKLLPGEYHKLVTCVNGGTSATLEPHAFQAGSEGERGWEREFLKQILCRRQNAFYSQCWTGVWSEMFDQGWLAREQAGGRWLVGWLVGWMDGWLVVA